MKQTLHQQLVSVAQQYANLTDTELPIVAHRMIGNRYLFQRIIRGSSLTCVTWERCMQWLSDNWPERRAWPKGVTRPERSK